MLPVQTTRMRSYIGKQDAGFAGGAQHPIDKLRAPGGAALGLTSLTVFGFAAHAPVVNILAGNKLADVQAMQFVKLAPQADDEAADTCLGQILFVAQQFDDAVAAGIGIGIGGGRVPVDAEAEIEMRADLAVEDFRKVAQPLHRNTRHIHTHGVHRGQAEQAVDAPQQGHKTPRAQQHVEAQGKGQHEGDEHVGFGEARIHAEQAKAAEHQLHKGEH